MYFKFLHTSLRAFSHFTFFISLWSKKRPSGNKCVVANKVKTNCPNCINKRRPMEGTHQESIIIALLALSLRRAFFWLQSKNWLVDIFNLTPQLLSGFCALVKYLLPTFKKFLVLRTLEVCDKGNQNHNCSKASLTMLAVFLWQCTFTSKHLHFRLGCYVN